MRAYFVFVATLIFTITLSSIFAGRGFAVDVSHRLEPNLRTEPPSDVRIEVTPIEKRLRFTNTVENLGQGPLHLVNGGVNGDVYQYLFFDDGTSPEVVLAGTFTYHPTHEHYHFDDFANYFLTESDGRNDTDFRNNLADVIPGTEVSKITFCLMDTGKVKGARASSQPTYETCGNDIQGISAGYFDQYRYYLPEQWVVIDGVPDGFYWLVSEADPFNRIVETRDDDNASATLVEISRNGTRVRKVR